VEPKALVDDLAGLMQEFALVEAEMTMGLNRVRFSRRIPGAATDDEGSAVFVAPPAPVVAPNPVEAPGSPVNSPMNGIYYGAPSPSSPPFVREGDVIQAGQVIGLIEAMKVFNEIPSPVGGTVVRLGAESGQIVGLGDTLLWVK
jgi:acetyl-CoA carboxylase biotin carboxyl carrier protein